jgi:hypothetical protein
MLNNNPLILYQLSASLPIEIYVKPPTKFIIDNCSELLPTWEFCPQTIMMILFHTKMRIDTVNSDVKKEKERLKIEFLELGKILKGIFEHKKCLIEIIDPQEGKPIDSDEVTINFDMIAIIHQLLGFSFDNTDEGCKVLNHPTQKTAIYPGILLSDKNPEKVNYILKEIF